MLYARQTWMTQLILTISLKRLSSLNPKGFYYSYPWSCSLSGKRTSFCTGLSLENCGFLLTFSTALLHSVSYFFFLNVGGSIPLERIDLVNSDIIFLSPMALLRGLTFLLGTLALILKFLLFWIYLFFLTLVFVLQ